MNILGTLYLADDINFVRLVLSDPTSRTICLSTDEADNTLEKEFPMMVQKATILCAPPSAIYKDIDGDHEGFVNEYTEYLNSSSVTDFIALVLAFMHRGGNVLLYIPSYTEDSIWVNTLLINLLDRFGILAGMSEDKSFSYNPEYDAIIADVIYTYGYISVFDYISSYPFTEPSPQAIDRLNIDLAPYCEPGQCGAALFCSIKLNIICNGANPIVKPAVIFG